MKEPNNKDESPVLGTDRLKHAAPTATQIDQMFLLCQDETVEDVELPIGRNYTRDKADVWRAQSFITSGRPWAEPSSQSN